MNNFNAGWYIIYTMPRHEKKVHTRLVEMKINSFLPTRKVLRTWHDRKKMIDNPLFPSYVFIYLTDQKNFYDVMETDGYLYYVKSGREIARVNDSIINSIRMIVDMAKELEISSDRFLPGRKLVISDGPLAGLYGEVIQSIGKQKLLVRIELLQRSIVATLPEEYLLAV
jgi:transcriptional antiterminator RfaH